MPLSITEMWNKKSKPQHEISDETRIMGKPWFRTKIRYLFLLVFLMVVLVLFFLLSVSLGIADENIVPLFKLFYQGEIPLPIRQIILEMRMPRALAACLTGAAFALSGAVMQGITRNPLADAGLLGINAGAGFFVTLGAVVWSSMSSFTTMILAFMGSGLAVFMVYGLGNDKKKQGTISLILAGSAVSALLTALSQGLALTFGLSKSLSFWSSGSLSGISWRELNMAWPWITGAILAGFIISGRLSILALGEESAAGLGLNIWVTRTLGMIIVFILAGVSVSLVGGISFVGIIIPHTVRFLVGNDYRRILPVSALLGGALLIISDVAARKINEPFDTPVGALVSLIGVPFFLIMMYQKKGDSI